MDWLEDSVSFLPSFLDDPYNSDDINSYQWWDESHYSFPTVHDLIDHTHTDTSLNSALSDNTIENPITIITTTKSGENPEISNHLQKVSVPNPSKKRKSGGSHKIRRSHRGSETRKSSGNSNGMEGRWAEQLLNPCAAAVVEGNFTRVQHLLYVLHELASLSGDANHRLAHHGLRALTHHISPSSSDEAAAAPSFTATEPRLFQKSLIKFHEVSPWFAFPNVVANSAILQLLTDQDRRGVHILDIGVSHGIQWPTLLESLTRRPGGPPPLVRITTISDSHHSSGKAVSFSTAPPGHDCSSRLLTFAKSINVNLEIDSLGFHDLVMTSLKPNSRETLIICAQFRLHGLSHEERTEFLVWAKRMRPSGLILSESEAEECGPGGGGGFGEGFRRRVEWLWRFLESTSAAFKGRESEERRVVEGEAARGLAAAVAEGGEGKEGWCLRMRGVGFEGVALGEDAIDAGRALLRKYDGNWEMRVDNDAADGFVGLWWKGQPVSFCSLWKLSDS